MSDLQVRLPKSLPIVLPEYLRSQRWFAGKAGQIEAVEILDIVGFGDLLPEAQMVLAEVHYAAGLPERYALPLMMMDDAGAGVVVGEAPSEAVGIG